MLNSLKTLDKNALYELLSSRFPTQEKRLSQIPSPTLLHDGQKAAKKIADAIKDGKKITLVGDYDVDGVISSVIMASFFEILSYPLDVIIPNRFRDGYGVSPKILQRVDADLIITVDNGISAIEASKICKERAIELIITDHHTPSDILPDAYAIVNPKLKECEYPFKEICGAEVAWLLLALVKKELNLSIDMKQFLDILCIAIIADIMPLVDINRTLVKKGLEILATSNRPASIIIRDFLNKPKLSSEDIAFQISPRINSAGRLEDAMIAFEFFMSKTTNEAYLGFERLNSLNEERKEIEAQTTKEAIELVDTDADIIVVAKKGWHEGVVGIVAARLVDRFEKPAIVLSIDDEVAKGSARSLGDIDIYELIYKNKKYLSKFGGHKMAAGLSMDVEMIKLFRDDINILASKINKSAFIPKDDALGIINSDDIDFELLDMLEYFEPYGEANPRPKFIIKNSEVVGVKLMGKDKSHSKIEIRQHSHKRETLELIYFRNIFDIPETKKITCSYTINKNIYNSRVSIQLLVQKIYK